MIIERLPRKMWVLLLEFRRYRCACLAHESFSKNLTEITGHAAKELTARDVKRAICTYRHRCGNGYQPRYPIQRTDELKFGIVGIVTCLALATMINCSRACRPSYVDR